MQEADVAQAIETLEAQGKEPSIGNLRKIIGHGSLRDITKYRKQLLPHRGRAQPMEVTRTVDAPAVPVAVLAPAVVPPAPAAAPPPPKPPPATLLAQAEAAYQAALAAERRARRDVDFAPQADRGPLTQVWHTATRQREQAAALIAQRQRARDHLRTAIPAARIANRRAQGELAALEDEISRRLIRARREATLAREDLDRMVQDLTTIAGPEAVPGEEG